MRALVLTNLYPPDVLGGYELGCRQVVDALAARGHAVRVLTSIPRHHPAFSGPGVDRRLRLTDVYDADTEQRVSWHARRVRYLTAFGVDAANVHALVESVADFRPDVVYAWSLVGVGGLGLLAAVQHLGLPWVMHLMDKVPRELAGLRPEATPSPGMVAAFLRLCRGRFLCCSRTTLDEIAVGGLDLSGRTRLLPNWVTTHGTAARPDADYLPGGRLRVISAGAYVPWKGTDITVRALGLLRDRGVANVSLDVYGFGDPIPLRSLVQSLALGDHVRLLGPRTQAELDRLYAGYDVFAFPTWEREPMAFAPLEAAAHGCVPILPRVSGNSEWFVHGVDCLKANRTPHGLAALFEAILAGAVPLGDIGRRAARTIQREFTLHRAVPVIEAELQAAIDAGGGPAGTPADAYRLALLAEKVFTNLIHDTPAA